MITKDMLAGVFLDSPELEAYLLLCSKNSEEVGAEFLDWYLTQTKI